MTSLMSSPVFQTYVLSSAVIVLILYGLGFWTATVRAKRKAVVNPEDVGVNPGAKVVDTEHEDVQRIKRAHLNGLENAVPFFLLGFLYSMTEPSLTMARVLFFTFVGARLLHAIFYVSAKQPFRTLVFTVGGIVNLVMLVQVVRVVL